MAICGSCGAAVSDDARFCSRCGNPPWGEPEGEGIAWSIEVPLLTNPFILGDLGRALVALLVVVGLIFIPLLGWANGWTGALQGLLATLVAGLAISLIGVLTLGVLLGNRFEYRFHVTDAGVRIISRSKRTRFIHRAALLGGILTRNVPAIGAGIAGAANEVMDVQWGDLHGLKPRPDRNAVTLCRRFLPDLHVFCVPENFDAVLSFLEERTPGGGRR